MKIDVTFKDCSASEAAHLIAQAGGQSPVGNPIGGGSALPPPSAPAPTHAPPPPTQQVVANPKQAEVTAAMQAYSGTHKAQGVKAVLGICNLAKVTDANEAQLDWLLLAFKSMQAPAALGAK